jgi:hypothetical protein
VVCCWWPCASAHVSTRSCVRTQACVRRASERVGLRACRRLPRGNCHRTKLRPRPSKQEQSAVRGELTTTRGQYRQSARQGPRFCLSSLYLRATRFLPLSACHIFSGFHLPRSRKGCSGRTRARGRASEIDVRVMSCA